MTNLNTLPAFPLSLSADRKVTNMVNRKGDGAAIKNAFGLPAGVDGSCPGMTSFCEKICYAKRTENQYGSASALVRRNFQVLLYADYLDGVDGMAAELSTMIAEFRRVSVRKGAPLNFRIHWDGDFFSVDYAKAWAQVISDNPDISFWVYTRSFTPACNVIPTLVNLDNLTLYLSSDADNLALAKTMASRYTVLMASVADTFADSLEMLNDGKSYRCPENRVIDDGTRHGKRVLPLITEKGSACARCGICIEGRGSVAFSASKK